MAALILNLYNWRKASHYTIECEGVWVARSIWIQ